VQSGCDGNRDSDSNGIKRSTSSRSSGLERGSTSRPHISFTHPCGAFNWFDDGSNASEGDGADADSEGVFVGV
jgi:hypothetical protein